MEYCSEVLKIGSAVEELSEQNMLILFCGEAPESLIEFCVIHKHDWAVTDFKLGDKFALGNHMYDITAIGDMAKKNLNELGHVTLCFDGAAEPRLSGYIHLAGDDLYIPKVGEDIVIFQWKK